MSQGEKKYFGKYRGTISSNVDPSGQGRVQVTVPSILQGQDTGWAMPSSPYAGSQVGIYAIPPVGSYVWVEFEGGDINHPVWSGSFWGPGDAPTQDPTTNTKMIKTANVTITFDDTPGAGGVTIEIATGAKISMDSTGITLSCGSSSISITPTSVSINNGALEVV
ncbi:MAG: phage baseplate assembly protein V [Thaumarchaeota archaeon]|nr:phage baseplate assembly protein V [Nitrososphaerota archaeon]